MKYYSNHLQWPIILSKPQIRFSISNFILIYLMSPHRCEDAHSWGFIIIIVCSVNFDLFSITIFKLLCQHFDLILQISYLLISCIWHLLLVHRRTPWNGWNSKLSWSTRRQGPARPSTELSFYTLQLNRYFVDRIFVSSKGACSPDGINIIHNSCRD